MLWSLAILILCQAAGESLHVITGLPVPGTVIGLGLLLLGLCLLKPGRVQAASRAVALPAADALLPYLGLLFVPAGVTAVMHAGRLAPTAPAVLFGLLGSTGLALVVTGRVAQALLSRSDRLVAITRASPAARPCHSETAP